MFIRQKVGRHLIICFLMILFYSSSFTGDFPKLKFEKVIGDLRGKGMENISVAVGDDGKIYLLMVSGRIAVFDKDGKYLKSLKVEISWPPYYHYLSVVGGRILLGDYKKDYPWVFLEERKGTKNGFFLEPSSVVTDEKGRVFVADTGNKRIQIFINDENLPKKSIPLSSGPINISIKNSLLAVITNEGELIIYEENGDLEFLLKDSLKIGPGISVAISPDKSILVAFRAGPNYYQLKKYEIKNNSLKEIQVIAPSYTDQWPNFYPDRAPMILGPDNEIWFCAIGRKEVLSLDPKIDKVKKRINTPFLPCVVGFLNDKIYVSGYPPSDTDGPILYVIDEKGEKRNFWERDNGILYKEKNVPVWGFLPDNDGGVYIRIVEEGYQKGWPALTIKKIYPDGTIKPFIDFGNLFAKRTKFHPAYAPYSLQFDREKNIIISALPLVAVVKVNSEGKIIWEASPQPQGEADRVDFGAPVDTSLDNKGNIWVIDSEKNKIFCLSSSGKLLFEYGGYANVDDTEGKGFDNPTGIEVVTVDGNEFLYVGDTGNNRIVKYKIIWD